MTWFEDLTPYSFLPGEPVLALNVGWLEHEKPFPTATPDPAFVERLHLLVRRARSHATRGMHLCDFCPPLTRNDLLDGSIVDEHLWGHAEIRAVGSDGTRYAAPTLIAHYVESHRYAPPRAFVDAIMRCAWLTWEAARDAGLCLSCGTRFERDGRMDEFLEPEIVALLCPGCGATSLVVKQTR